MTDYSVIEGYKENDKPKAKEVKPDSLAEAERNRILKQYAKNNKK